MAPKKANSMLLRAESKNDQCTARLQQSKRDQQESLGPTAKPEEASDGGQAASSTPSIGLSSPLLPALKSLACGRFDSLVSDDHSLLLLERHDGP